MNIAKVKFGFDGTHPPKDETFMVLLDKAQKGELLCHMAIIAIEGVRPFSDSKPETPKIYRQYLQKKLDEHKFPPMYVYRKDDHFIMSDDYHSYYFLKDIGHKEALCIVLGEAEGKYLLKKSEPFQLSTEVSAEVVPKE